VHRHSVDIGIDIGTNRDWPIGVVPNLHLSGARHAPVCTEPARHAFSVMSAR
jgi:hypothetical protein